MQDVINKNYLIGVLEGSFIKKLPVYSEIITKRKEQGKMLEKKSKEMNLASKLKPLLTSAPDSSTLEKVTELLDNAHAMDKSLMVYNALTKFCHFDLTAELVLISGVYTSFSYFSPHEELHKVMRQFHIDNKNGIDSLENILNKDYDQKSEFLKHYIELIDKIRLDEVLASSTNPLLVMLKKNLEVKTATFSVYRQLSDARQLLDIYQLSTNYPLHPCYDMQTLCERAVIGFKGCIEKSIAKAVEDNISKKYSHLKCLVVEKKFNEFMRFLD